MNTISVKSTESDQSVPFPNIEDDTRTHEKPNHKKPPTHKRSISGSLLNKLFRPSSELQKEDDEPDKGRAHRIDINDSYGRRKRKGSLRKTVLGKGRDRKISEKKSPLSSNQSTPVQSPLVDSTPRTSLEIVSPTSPDLPPRWPFRTLSKVSLPSIRSSIASFEPASSAASITSPTLPNDSTDDEDLSLPRMVARKAPSSSGDSYFPSMLDIGMARRSTRARSPLASSPQSTTGSPVELEEWDYSETAFWGYVILIVTWIVFVVGMGSCLGIWSWAWDVGETPYAPPELEDDPTLPIVGYYPALLVLTCIMAWVWVVVAWVGMKYFRHADFRGDDNG